MHFSQQSQQEHIRCTETPLCETHPKFDEEKGILRTFSKEFLQASLLFGEFVVNLPDVHRLQQGVAVGVVGLPDVYKQVLVVLQKETQLDLKSIQYFQQKTTEQHMECEIECNCKPLIQIC